MYGSPSAAEKKDRNLSFGRQKEESELHSEQQMSSGLLRHRFAPSSLLGEVCENFLPVRPTSPETESIFARYLSPDLREDIREKPTSAGCGGGGGGERNLHYKQQPPETEQNSEFSGDPPHMLFHSQQHQSVMDGANLIRQNSSPAGFFSHLNVDSGYGLMRGMAAGIKGQISFSSRQNSLSQISVMGSDGGCVSVGSPPEQSSNGRCFLPGYPASSWEESLLSDTFPGFKRSLNQQTQHQNGEVKGHHTSCLTHQFSLPKTSSEMAAIEKFMQFQDAVPCKIRAKRGCATHPRSIAERVRRTRISERMRKLQELVPNMDKQTNTADMLDLAVDYIKDLQRQVKTLTDSRVSCTCPATKQKPFHLS